ncbi:MAG: nicotinate (nicotinamide) nucleotide adenylyltransferase, partial [Candidatus Pacearchaeota archaeon]|nr:nicotinate (nicotinamide) nucleotide adenylyltransferase [Candidatus Pacearchaeota archaeon]
KSNIDTEIPLKKEPMVNVAILGGAFNPITLGHIQIAMYVLSACSLFNEIWIMPCYKHIYSKKMAESDHRLEMCRLAALIDDRIKVSDYEIKNRFEGGTYYLLKQLLDEDFIKNHFHCSLIIGQDNANTFNKWVKHKELKQLIRFIVIPRQGVKRDTSIDWYLTSPHIFLDADSPIMEVSSTQVRNLLQKQDYNQAGNLLDPAVLSYIKKHNLYCS